MSEAIVPLPNGWEGRVTIGSSTPYGTWASAIVFDSEANIIASTSMMQYHGYTIHEMILRNLIRALPGLEADVIEEAVEDAGWPHECDGCDDD